MTVKLCYIVPTNYLKLFGSRGDMHLALAMYLKGYNHPYTSFYRDESLKKEIIMDNNVFELGISAPIEELVEKASWINASYLVSPDALYSGIDTIKNLDEFTKVLQKTGSKIKIFAVVQGKNLEDWLWCHKEIASRSEVDMIGLSILAIPYAFREITNTMDISINRVVAMNFMKVGALYSNKKYHCLGNGSNIKAELNTMRDCNIYSNDSCSVFQTVCKRNKSYFGGYVPLGKPAEKLKFDLASNSLTKEQIKLVLTNIRLTKEWVRKDF